MKPQKSRKNWEHSVPMTEELSGTRASALFDRQSTSARGRTHLLKSFWVEIRPNQWIKNFLVLAPVVFSKNLLDFDALSRALETFVLFCLVSSSVYILNDIKDREKDRLHPNKSNRPIAKGDLDVRVAFVVMSALLCSAVVGGAFLSLGLSLVLLIYWFINFLYSTWLKHQVILDVFALASGFLLRLAAGAIAIEGGLSHWLLLCTTLLALFLGFSKRRHEIGLLAMGAKAHRQVLGEYNVQFLDMMIGIVTASTVMSYALYTVSDETVGRFGTDALLLTLPFVLYGVFRYLYLVYHKNQGGDPTRDLIADKCIVIDLCLWAATTGIIVYWPNLTS